MHDEAIGKDLAEQLGREYPQVNPLAHGNEVRLGRTLRAVERSGRGSNNSSHSCRSSGWHAAGGWRTSGSMGDSHAIVAQLASMVARMTGSKKRLSTNMMAVRLGSWYTRKQKMLVFQ